MTNDEAVRCNKQLRLFMMAEDAANDTNRFLEESYEALDMAIKALEQATCEDCISRQAVEEMIKAELPERGMWEIEGDKEKETVCEVCVELMQKLSDLPPVTPQPKTGKWIFHKSFDNGRKNCNECIECSQCHTWLGHDCYAKTPYCPICGARMEVENEDRD